MPTLKMKDWTVQCNICNRDLHQGEIATIMNSGPIEIHSSSTHMRGTPSFRIICIECDCRMYSKYDIRNIYTSCTSCSRPAINKMCLICDNNQDRCKCKEGDLNNRGY